MLCLSFLGVVIHNASQHARALRRLLLRHSSRLQTALARSRTQAARTNQMFNSLDVAVARVSSAGEILAVNDAFVELFALDSDDLSLPGRAVEYDGEWGEPLPPAERPLARAARGELAEGERAWLYDPDGQWHVVSVSTRPLPRPDGDSTVLIVQDVSELHRVEQERRAIVAGVSHELRNPLTAVLGRTGTAARARGPSVACPRAGRDHRRGGRAHAAAGDARTWHRPTARRIGAGGDGGAT